MRTHVIKILTAFAFACAATSAFAHAQLEKSTPPVGGTVASPSEIRLEFSEGVEPKFSGVTLTARGRRRGGARRGLGRSRPPKRADRPGRQTPIARRLYRALACGVGRHPSHARNVRIHRQVNRSPVLSKPTGALQVAYLEARKEMSMTRFSALALALALSAAATPALAQQFKAGDITIDKAWARATPKGAEVGAGYFVVHNNGNDPGHLDRRLGRFRRRRDP